MKKPVEVQIFVYGEDQKSAIELDLAIPIDECDLRDITFFNIEAITPYIEDEKEYVAIHNSSGSFIAPLTYSEMKTRLFEAGYYEN